MALIRFSVCLGFELPSDYIRLTASSAVITSSSHMTPRPGLSSEEGIFSLEPPLTFPGE